MGGGCKGGAKTVKHFATTQLENIFMQSSIALQENAGESSRKKAKRNEREMSKKVQADGRGRYPVGSWG